MDLGTPFADNPARGFLAFAAASDALLVAGSGIVRSTDGGVSWHESSSGILAATVRALTLDRQNPERLLALEPFAGSYPSGMLRSLDRGASWNGVELSPELGDSVLVDLAVDPDDPLHYLVATHSLYGLGFKGVASSVDAGQPGPPSPSRSTACVPFALEVDPLQSSRLFLLGTLEDYFCRPDCSTFRSDDSGESWQCIDLAEDDDHLLRVAPSPFEPGGRPGARLDRDLSQRELRGGLDGGRLPPGLRARSRFGSALGERRDGLCDERRRRHLRE